MNGKNERRIERLEEALSPPKDPYLKMRARRFYRVYAGLPGGFGDNSPIPEEQLDPALWEKALEEAGRLRTFKDFVEHDERLRREAEGGISP